MNLRDSVLAALSTLPGTRHFHIHVLVTAPRKHTTLYPYANPRPRIYVQDILILLSEQLALDSPRVLVSAVEACVYHAPTTSAAILYISKVDSTGQGLAPSPTSTLVSALVRWYADPKTRPVHAQHLWLHLFARAQGHYLFPNSIEYEGKRPLSDVRLCIWWRRLLGAVAGDLQASFGDQGKIRLYYVLPGYNELEAQQAIGAVPLSSMAGSPPWVYGHPYSQTEIPLPCPPPEGSFNLGHLIPSFEDDPKNRFMDEIAVIGETDSITSPVRKRARTTRRAPAASREEGREDIHGGSEHHEAGEREKEKDGKTPRPNGELGTVRPDEFWERMSFRQECVTGAVTGFFVAAFSFSLPSSTAELVSRPLPLAPQPGQVPTAMNRRILTSLMQGNEFSTVERAYKATEVLEGAIRGLCEGLSSLPPSSRGKPSQQQTQDGMLAPPRTPPRKHAALPYLQDMSPNPFDEPEATLETYHAHIYGTVSVSNPALAPKTSAIGARVGATSAETDAQKPKVNVLAVRKKKKRTESDS
ncbi:hypothetical protein EW146_g8725 [Bondarzewia mesenterica]|uniref:histone acetyltransferase n=1 Tax=Bondarzewia mesenterica TaxID=1095465 RepID=A0A4S4LBX9_9AGAM|nr:hypothetical protein EW146_g8725 [Bondarzewia mesenterica]